MNLFYSLGFSSEMARLSLLLDGAFLSHYVIKTSAAPFLLCRLRCLDLCFCMYQIIRCSMTKKSRVHVSHALVSNGIDVSRESPVAKKADLQIS